MKSTEAYWPSCCVAALKPGSKSNPEHTDMLHFSKATSSLHFSLQPQPFYWWNWSQKLHAFFWEWEWASALFLLKKYMKHFYLKSNLSSNREHVCQHERLKVTENKGYKFNLPNHLNSSMMAVSMHHSDPLFSSRVTRVVTVPCGLFAPALLVVLSSVLG